MTASLAPLLLAPALLLGAAAPAPGSAVDRDPAPGARVTWTIDATHSEVSFRVRHLVSRVRGGFNDFSGTIVADPADLSTGSVQVEIRTESIDTNNQRRDNHLRSADFFDAASHPAITFRSTRVEADGRSLRVHGDLTIRGVTKPVVLTGRMLEMGGAPGKRRIGFEASTTVNRLDYGVSWNRAAEGGGVVLGDEVDIILAVEAVEQPAS